MRECVRLKNPKTKQNKTIHQSVVMEWGIVWLAVCLYFAHSKFYNFTTEIDPLWVSLIFEPKCKLLLLLLRFFCVGVVVVVVVAFFCFISIQFTSLFLGFFLREMCDRVSIYLRLLLIFGAGDAAATTIAGALYCAVIQMG